MIRRIVAAAGLTMLLSACVPIVDPSRWDPTMYCATVGPDAWCDAHSNHHSQGPEDEMICLTPDGYVFRTGLQEAVSNGWICDHVGMGEG